MTKFYLGKLVPPGVIARMEESGQVLEAHPLRGVKFFHALGEKVAEETAEVVEGDIDPKELVQAVVAAEAVKRAALALAAEAGISPEDFEEMITARLAKAGNFEDGQYVETASAQPDTEWHTYYADRPERFPVVEE